MSHSFLRVGFFFEYEENLGGDKYVEKRKYRCFEKMLKSKKIIFSAKFFSKTTKVGIFIANNINI